MNGWRILIAVLAFWLAISLQAGIADRMSVFGCQPDFLLVSLACLGLFAQASGGAVLGFFAGLLYGASVQKDMSTYIFSRSLAGFLSGWFNALEMQPNALVAMVVTAGVTVVARLSFLLVSPPSPIGGYIPVTIGMVIYNALIAIPAYLLLTRLMGKSPQRYG